MSRRCLTNWAEQGGLLSFFTLLLAWVLSSLWPLYSTMKRATKDCIRLLPSFDRASRRGQAPSPDKLADKSLKAREVLYDKLKSLSPVFVLDNTLRESTVAQPRGHTLADKHLIYDQVAACGFTNIITGCFNKDYQVDDLFVHELIKRRQGDVSQIWGFSEMFVPPTTTTTTTPTTSTPTTTSTTTTTKVVPANLPILPIGLEKMKNYGLVNPILEMDFACQRMDWDRMTNDRLCRYVLDKLQWVKANLSPQAKTMINYRDLTVAATRKAPFQRMIDLTRFLSRLPPHVRPFGLLFEDPAGDSLPSEIGAWTRVIRQVMVEGGWEDGLLLIHVHRGWGLADGAVLESLANGANGIWCAVCEEGAATGHACSANTLINLARMGNRYVQEHYDLPTIRQAAINVTRIVTGCGPQYLTEIYGPRALDVCFTGSMGVSPSSSGFDLATAFGERAPVRITTMVDEDMIQTRLKQVFGKYDDEGHPRSYSPCLLKRMREHIHDDLCQGIKLDYSGILALAMLYEGAGGTLSPSLIDMIIRDRDVMALDDHPLVKEFDASWTCLVGGINTSMFYNRLYEMLLKRFVPGFKCSLTIQCLEILDVGHKGLFHYQDLIIRIKWALIQFPHDLGSLHDVYTILFRHWLLPTLTRRARVEEEEKGRLVVPFVVPVLEAVHTKPLLSSPIRGRRTTSIIGA